jgi:hypothetical protein
VARTETESNKVNTFPEVNSPEFTNILTNQNAIFTVKHSSVYKKGVLSETRSDIAAHLQCDIPGYCPV